MFTDGAATGGTGNSPVFSSASYNFVAGDVGAKVYIALGTNWTIGWYEVASVAANAATLKAAIGEAVPRSTMAPNLTAGCASTASPTGATWTIDYSQQNAAQFSYTDLASAGTGLTVSSAAFPFGKQQVGNCLVIVSGTNFNVGRYILASVAAGVATVTGAGNITTGAGSAGVGGQGGALASPAVAMVVLNAATSPSSTVAARLYIKSGTYSITTTSSNVANGVMRPAWNGTIFIVGYGTIRGDRTKPVIQVNVASCTILLGQNFASWRLEDIEFDGNSQTASLGVSTGGSAGSVWRYVRCYAHHCTTSGFKPGSAGDFLEECYALSCGTGFDLSGNNAFLLRCVARNNTGAGFGDTGTGHRFVECISAGNGGKGFGTSSFAGDYIRCIAYGNTSDGFARGGAALYMDCISYGNGGYGFNISTNSPWVRVWRCAAGTNTSGANPTGLQAGVIEPLIALTGDPFTDGANGDFRLDATANEGLALRAQSYTFPGITSTVSYTDLGAVQHQDAGGSASILVHPGMSGGCNG